MIQLLTCYLKLQFCHQILILSSGLCTFKISWLKTPAEQPVPSYQVTSEDPSVLASRAAPAICYRLCCDMDAEGGFQWVLDLLHLLLCTERVCACIAGGYKSRVCSSFHSTRPPLCQNMFTSRAVLQLKTDFELITCYQLLLYIFPIKTKHCIQGCTSSDFST